ncbi:YqiA/YcfP family alpha/beta fold hydrolase, partial [Pantoea endophytica]
LQPFYEIIWDDVASHKFKNIAPHLQRIKTFKLLA